MRAVEVTCEVVGGETRTVSLAGDATYADLLAALELSPQEATAVVDGDPVPADAAVAADRVRVLRLVQGGRPAGGAAVTVRPARSAERSAARAVVDRAMLTVPDDPTWLVAVACAPAEAAGSPAGDPPPVVGSLALDGREVAAVAVRLDRRGEGVGRALVDAAAERRPRLTARFRPGVREFYEAVGFAVEPGADGRLRGVR